MKGHFFQRIREVMKGKYTLTDKFIAVTAVLFPCDPDNTLEEDYKKFRRLKELRDSISHGEKFSERDLPVHELATLLRKYVLARLEMPDPAVNAETPQAALPSP